MKNPAYFLAGATFFNILGSGIVLLDLSIWGAGAQTIAGGLGLLFTACAGGLMVLGKGGTSPQ